MSASCLTECLPYTVFPMKKITLTLLGASLATLTACASRTPDMTMNDLLKNPLFAEFYYEDLTNQLVSLELNEDEATKDPDKKAMIDALRTESLRRANEIEKVQTQGKTGAFIQAKDIVQGEVLLLDGTLFFGPEFIGTPGVDVRVYLSTMLDPRDEGFPDANAVDLGPLHTFYGEQWYEVPEPPEGVDYRSVVLWDADLERVSSFAQISD